MRKKKFKLKMPKRKKKIPATVPSSSTPPPWTELPTDVAANILQRVSCVDLLENVQFVCTAWRSLCRDPVMWRVIDFSGVDEMSDAEFLCRQAVDLSQGQLLDIKIQCFGSDELLLYIAERSNQLRCLRLACCYNISGKGLSEAAEKLPQLEELHIFFMKAIRASDIEATGLSCPLLKSFTFNGRGYRFPLSECNEYPMAIAKSMPALRHLRFFGNKMTNVGVEAILDGCPELESLDLRECFSVNLRGDTGSRCLQRLKVLKYPNDSTSDYEWDAEIYACADDDDDYYYTSEFSDVYSLDDYDDFTDPFHEDYRNDGDGYWFNYGNPWTDGWDN